jgi:hypothetical protein
VLPQAQHGKFKSSRHYQVIFNKKYYIATLDSGMSEKYQILSDINWRKGTQLKS